MLKFHAFSYRYCVFSMMLLSILCRICIKLKRVKRSMFHRNYKRQLQNTTCHFHRLQTKPRMWRWLFSVKSVSSGECSMLHAFSSLGKDSNLRKTYCLTRVVCCSVMLKTRKILFLNMFSLITNLPVIHLLKYLITLYLTTLYVTIVEVSTICLLFLRTTCSLYAMNARHLGSLQGRRVADNSKKKAKPICVNFLYKNC